MQFTFVGQYCSCICSVKLGKHHFWHILVSFCKAHLTRCDSDDTRRLVSTWDSQVTSIELGRKLTLSLMCNPQPLCACQSLSTHCAIHIISYHSFALSILGELVCHSSLSITESRPSRDQKVSLSLCALATPFTYLILLGWLLHPIDLIEQHWAQWIGTELTHTAN